MTDTNYYTAIADAVQDIGLTVHAFRLYFHIKRMCDRYGYCAETERELSEICKMSFGKIQASKMELERCGLIVITSARRGLHMISLAGGKQNEP